MKVQDQEEFYIGYLPQAPTGLARLARRVVAVLLAVAAVVALLLLFGQGRFLPSSFEFGVTRQFEGVVRARPIPTLLVERPGKTGTLPVFSRYTLVAQGKHGADELVAAADGRRVRLSGTLIHRDGLTMIEVAPESVQIVAGLAGPVIMPAEAAASLGKLTLIGEIVDSKCYLGVMNPGHTKPHRECAARCISGGIPPLFVVRDAVGKMTGLWLVSANGEPVNQQVLELVAEPVEITGEVSRDGENLVLRSDPSTYRRVP